MIGELVACNLVGGLQLVNCLTFRHQRFVGAVSHISIDQTAKSSRGVVVSSEGGVLAVLNPRDGSIRK